MSWQTNMVPIVRGLVFDMTTPYRYSCTRMEELIVVAAVMTMQDVDFSTSYTVDLEAVSITPDPSDSGDRDFEALVSLKAACIISQGEHRDAASKAFSVKDGPAFVDTKDRAKHLGDISDDACTNYQRARHNYQVGDGSLGRAIVGPYNAGQTADAGRRFS